jgi:hypothetical protein
MILATKGLPFATRWYTIQVLHYEKDEYEV